MMIPVRYLTIAVIFALGAFVVPAQAQNLITDPSVAAPPDNPEFMQQPDVAPPPVQERRDDPAPPSRSELPVLSLPDEGAAHDSTQLLPDDDFFFDPMNPNGLPSADYDPERAFQAMSNAQDQGAEVEPEGAAEENVPTPYAKQEVNPNSIPSMLFTVWEYNALQEAQRNIGRALVRPTEDGFEAGEEAETVSRPPPEERYISLAGIVYGGGKNWTIWLNGQRVTPKALPAEILDLKVYREYIEIKWFDNYTRGIFPIRLKPHQRFNLDTRIFLPG